MSTQGETIDFVHYRIVSRSYSSVAAIMAEFEADPDILPQALLIGHGIKIDRGRDPTLYIVLDSEMMQKMKDNRIDNPTLMQMIGTSRVIRLTKEKAAEDFEAMMKG